MDRKWWKEAVVYQIYPRSYKDSTGNGVGDLRGIIEKVDYINSLGVDVIWLNPVYQSPNNDNGYDISDYRKIMDGFGTLEDWETLLDELHKRDIKLIMDLVVNHTSSEHRWFKESRKSKDNPYRDYYIWKDSRDGNVPNNWETYFSGSVWEYDQTTDQYYLHLFDKTQPDLNWENEKVRQEVYDLMKFWLDKGIDGFRMDVINMISKDPSYADGDVREDTGLGDGSKYFVNGPRIHEFLHEMHQEVLSHYDVMTVGETPAIDVDDGIKYTAEDREELNMVFQFEHMGLDYGDKGKWSPVDWDFVELKKILIKWQVGLNDKGWNSIYFMNHDQPRTVSRFGNDQAYREVSAKMLAICLLTMKGTPYIYQGDEIGMTNYPFESVSELRDVEALNRYEVVKGRNLDFDEYFEGVKKLSRDNSRTPMQWTSEENAGFTTGTPWINVNPNYQDINVEKSLKDENSILNFYRVMIQIRKENLGLVYNDFEPLLEADEEVFAYKRIGEDEFLIILNFTKNITTKKVDHLSDYELIQSNYDRLTIENNQITLKPYEGVLLKK